MAKLKKTTRKSPSAAASNADLQAKAEQLSRGLADSAQQIWLAGVGAFQRAQHEGSKLFDALVKEGSTIETATRKLATGRVDAVRDAVEERVGTVRERAVDTWDRLEKVFEERVQRALTRLGVPSREDLVELTERVDQLTRALKQRGAAPAAKAPAKAAKKPAVKKAAAKPAKKAAKPVKKATTKAAAKPAKARKAALAPIAAPDAPQG
ncbi:phasin family protein [Silanimonas sp.]|jgi:poly(hydroxyalkanoate) granule-associated protein|uniref:phasin family protein n=1 Tax=Silanimonas sp. TaxID=1929290 RepID=UPI0022C16FF6|nr:phasin family protein [Silanimonas sp.]MCZ8165035.1 phasin family protein [Silanimonas sp.]